MAHPYAPDMSALALMGKGKGKGKDDTSEDWNCPSCGDRNFAKRVECRKCQTPNPHAKMPDMNDMGFKTVMCAFYTAGRCTKGAYCTFAHGEEELGLGRQMLESKVDAIPAPSLHELPLHVQQYLAGLIIKPLPLKQFLSMEEDQRELVMKQGTLHEARDATAMLISRMVKVRKMANIQAKIRAQNPNATFGDPFAQALAQPPASGSEFTVTFQPGPLGVGANWTAGSVDKVVTGGQGEALGLQIGDWFTKVNGVPYTEQLLDAARQFASNLGMEWALGNAGGGQW